MNLKIVKFSQGHIHESLKGNYTAVMPSAKTETFRQLK